MPLSKIQTTNNQVIPNLGRRNILINGAFQHWQRGTSFSSNVYGSDRWKFYAPGSHAYARSTDTPDSPNNFEFSASCTGSGDATGLTQFVESKNAKHIPSSGSTKVILSFYLKHTTNSGTAKITSVVGTMNSADNSGASTNRSTKNHNTTTSWARYTHEMTGADLTAAVTNGLVVTIKHNGSGNTVFLLTGCQLEINEAVTPFESRSFAEELSLCQRYFWILDDKGASSDSLAAWGRAESSSEIIWWVPFPVEMRAVPTIAVNGSASDVYANSVVNLGTYSGQSLLWPNQHRSSLQWTGVSGVNNTYGYDMVFTNSRTWNVEWRAEL